MYVVTATVNTVLPRQLPPSKRPANSPSIAEVYAAQRWRASASECPRIHIQYTRWPAPVRSPTDCRWSQDSDVIRVSTQSFYNRVTLVILVVALSSTPCGWRVLNATESTHLTCFQTSSSWSPCFSLTSLAPCSLLIALMSQIISANWAICVLHNEPITTIVALHGDIYYTYQLI